MTAHAPADDAGEVAECASCGEGMTRNECSKSQRPCGHHCNHSWTHDACDWCGVEFGESGAETVPQKKSTIAEAEDEIAALEGDKRFMASVLATRKAALIEARRERDEARAEADNLRATLAAVADLADEWANADGEPATAHDLTALTTVNRLGNHLRAVLIGNPR